MAPRFFASLLGAAAGFASLAGGVHRSGSSICSRRIASLGGRLRDLLAKYVDIAM